MKKTYTGSIQRDDSFRADIRDKPKVNIRIRKDDPIKVSNITKKNTFFGSLVNRSAFSGILNAISVLYVWTASRKSMIIQRRSNAGQAPTQNTRVNAEQSMKHDLSSATAPTKGIVVDTVTSVGRKGGLVSRIIGELFGIKNLMFRNASKVILAIGAICRKTNPMVIQIVRKAISAVGAVSGGKKTCRVGVDSTATSADAEEILTTSYNTDYTEVSITPCMSKLVLLNDTTETLISAVLGDAPIFITTRLAVTGTQRTATLRLDWIYPTISGEEMTLRQVHTAVLTDNTLEIL